MSIERESSCCAIASRSASSTITNSPFATSQPLTISSGPTSRSWVGHQRFWRIGVLHSRCSVRKLTSDCFALGVVARARPTGMLTKPKEMDPFQTVRMGPPLNVTEVPALSRSPPFFCFFSLDRPHSPRAEGVLLRRLVGLAVAEGLAPGERQAFRDLCAVRGTTVTPSSGPSSTVLWPTLKPTVPWSTWRFRPGGPPPPDYDSSVATTTATGTRTIAQLWRDAVGRDPDGPAYLVEENGEWHRVTWAEAGRIVDELAHGLLALGVRKGDAFAVLGSTRVEWVLFDFALALVGGVTAPIYMNSSARDTAYVIEHSEAIGVLCEDDEQRHKVDGLSLDHVLTFADLDALRARGREHAQTDPDAVERATAQIGEDDLYTYIYTSGTTGPPKACMIRHRNYYAMSCKVNGIEDFTVESDVMLLFLPLAHNFGRCMALRAPHIRYTVAFFPDPYAVAEALPAVRPTVFPSVPRVYEKVHTGITQKFAAEKGVKRALID